MQGFTPWELSSIKYTYHRYDRERKGYLNRSDIAALCKAFGFDFSPEQVASLFDEHLDANGDSRISFEELTRFLAHIVKGNDDVERFRAVILSDTSSMMAGATIGLVPALKGKAAVVVGSLFYDPIRLFRDYYVEYHAAVEAEYQRIHSRKTPVPQMSMMQVLLAHLRLGRSALATVWWLMYAVLLDTAVGALMFLTYARCRKWMFHKSILVDHPVQAEFFAGFAAGGVTGLLERPAKFLARNEVRKSALSMWRGLQWREAVTNGVMSMFAGVRFAIFRHTLSHGCFFSAFYFAQQKLQDVAFRRLQLERTSWKEALVVATSGCAAGAAFKLTSIPLTNVYLHVWRHERQMFGEFVFHTPLKQQWRIATHGTLGALAFTMPITGVAFLLYESAFLWATL